MNRLIRLIDKIGVLCGYLAAMSIVVIMLIMIVEIFSRTVFDTSIGFSWEVNGYLLGSCVFLGASSALKKDVHVRVSVVINLIPISIKRYLELLVSLCGFIITCYITWALSLLARHSWVNDIVSNTPEKIPMAYPQLLLTVGCGAFALQLISRALSVLLDIYKCSKFEIIEQA